MPFAVRDGLRLHWLLEGDSGRPALLLLHPDSADLSIWDATAYALLSDFRILRADRRGNGGDETPDGTVTTALLATDALAVMDAAGIDRAGVVGLGLGGWIAVEMALLAPARVQALVLIRPCAPMPASGAPDARLGDLAGAGRLSGVSCPTLVMGCRDAAAEPVEAGIVSAIPGARSVLLDSDHRSPLQAPSALASQLRSFFLQAPDVVAAEALLYEVGLANRRRILGDAYVEGALARRTPFNTEFQAMITRIAWHEIYSRPGLELPTRRLLVLAITAATARWEEFRLHLRAAVTVGGVSRDDIKEMLMQLAIYAGVPAANTGFAEASEIFAELDRDGD